MINGQTVESVKQYNQVAALYVNCNTDIAGNCAVQYAYGYLAADDTIKNLGMGEQWFKI